MAPTLEELISANCKSFAKHFGHQPQLVAYAPGRINIIGEHTDYNQGLSMPCAINRWVTVSIASTANKQVKTASTDFKGMMAFALGEDYEPRNQWEKYIYGCILLFSKTHSIPSGFEAVISGNVPIGSGVSSSAALEVAFMNTLNGFAKAGLDNLSLIKLCQLVEHQYLGVKSGLLDQYASQFSVAGKVMLLDFQDLSHQYISADIKGYAWVLCDTKVKRSLAGSKYSERVEETKHALEILQKKDKNIKTFRDIREEHLVLLEDVNEQMRIRHFISENHRTLEALKAFEKKDIKTLGKLLTASHKSLQHDYEVSCDELDFLAEQALKYAEGSRMMGGGFGGCTISLVKEENIPAFSEHIRKTYKEKFGMDTEINIYSSVDGSDVKLM